MNPFNRPINFGIKISKPITLDTSATIKTAAALKSLIFFICGCFCGDTKSAKFSIAELKASALKTKAIQNKITIHSNQLVFNKQAVTITNIAAAK